MGQESRAEILPNFPSIFNGSELEGVECQIREIYISFVTSKLGGKSGFGVLDKFFPYREQERKTRGTEFTKGTEEDGEKCRSLGPDGPPFSFTQGRL